VATAQENRERILKFVNELFRVRELAERVAKKLKTAVTNLIYYRASLNGVTSTPQTKSLRRKGWTMEGLVTSLGEAL
jgi:hypothetical protein